MAILNLFSYGHMEISKQFLSKPWQMTTIIFATIFIQHGKFTLRVMQNLLCGPWVTLANLVFMGHRNYTLWAVQKYIFARWEI